MSQGQYQHFTWDYSEASDILNIHKTGKRTEGSAELGDCTIDFDDHRNVIGLEIMHAAEFFQQVGIEKRQLKKLQKAELLLAQKGPNLTLIFVKLHFPQNVERVIPMPAPIVAGTLA